MRGTEMRGLLLLDAGGVIGAANGVTAGAAVEGGVLADAVRLEGKLEASEKGGVCCSIADAGAVRALSEEDGVSLCTAELGAVEDGCLELS